MRRARIAHSAGSLTGPVASTAEEWTPGREMPASGHRCEPVSPNTWPTTDLTERRRGNEIFKYLNVCCVHGDSATATARSSLN